MKLLLEISETDDPAQVLRANLLRMGGHSQAWPTDQEFSDAWMDRPVYKELRPAKVGAILGALELASRTPDQETTWAPVRETLTVEHVMPQSWDGSGHYPLEGANDDLRIRRNRLVHTFGNLTLLTQPLNSSVSNGPFLDHERNGATVEGKCSRFRGSLLLLNAYFLNPSMTTWEEEQIVCRGEKLLKAALSLWGRPASAAQEG